MHKGTQTQTQKNTIPPLAGSTTLNLPNTWPAPGQEVVKVWPLVSLFVPRWSIPTNFFQNVFSAKIIEYTQKRKKKENHKLHF